VDDRLPEQRDRLRLEVAGLSDLGCVRQNNEDSYGSFDAVERGAGHLLIVADGMGGAAGGEVASRMAVDAVAQVYLTAADAGDVGAVVRHALELANRLIYQRGADEPPLSGMGTTCTVAVVKHDVLTVGHVGDSRAYLLQGSRIEQITCDHSLAAELARRCDPGAAVPEAGRHVLTRCLGVSPDVQVDVIGPIDLESGDTLLLCSDGLSGPVTAEELHALASAHEPEIACRRLVELARERGGPDNITVQIARLVPAGD
jgi:protein phosphatase